ncbi:MAG: sirohydrochlorin cobaltochelatase, partial [Firmicutes bacterium]|nr:sirohydrochlorin cobaltochelatase [Bacillota bacterium]
KEKLEDPGYFGDDTGDASKDDPLNQDNIGENELLVASFGTSFNGSRAEDIGGVEKALQKAFPEWSVRRAFTAQIIINHVQARDEEKIDNMEQALDRAVANGVKNLVIQPTHLMHGAEYDELVAAVEAYRDKFESVQVAEPLLGEVGADASAINADKESAAKAMVAEAVKVAGADSLEALDADGTAIVFMGHGTGHDAAITYTQMQTQFDKLGYKNVFVGTVEGNPAETALPEVKKAVEAAGYTKIILRPMMVVAGDHANNDMAADEEGSWYYGFVNGGEFEVEGADAPVEIGEGFGADNVTCQIEGLGRIADIQAIYVAHTGAVIE